MWIAWTGFLAAVVVVIIGARYHLPLALLAGTLVLAITTLSPTEFFDAFTATITSPDTIILILALGIIPIIGGILQVSGKLQDIINNLRVGRRAFLGTTPALIGLLPIPGGALFSSPLVDKAAQELDGHVKTGINVWFRHILYFIYPISYALIIPADLANLNIYRIIIFQIPLFLMTITLGYFFLLRRVDGEMKYSTDFDAHALTPPLLVLITAPVVHFVLTYAYDFQVANITVLIAVISSLIFSILIIGDDKENVIREAIGKMKPWNFMLLIFCLYFFINVFQVSGIDVLIEDLHLSNFVLIVVFGFFLGLATGRIILPASIIIPIYMGTSGLSSMPILVFSLMYLSIFLGYAITPVHPCISISLEYFKGSMYKFLKLMAPLVIISLVIASVLFMMFV